MEWVEAESTESDATLPDPMLLVERAGPGGLLENDQRVNEIRFDRIVRFSWPWPRGLELRRCNTQDLVWGMLTFSLEWYGCSYTSACAIKLDSFSPLIYWQKARIPVVQRIWTSRKTTPSKRSATTRSFCIDRAHCCRFICLVRKFAFVGRATESLNRWKYSKCPFFFYHRWSVQVFYPPILVRAGLACLQRIAKFKISSSLLFIEQWYERVPLSSAAYCIVLQRISSNQHERVQNGDGWYETDLVDGTVPKKVSTSWTRA